MNLAWARRGGYKKIACEGTTPPETLQNENTQPEKAIRPPVSHQSRAENCRFMEVTSLHLSGFYFM